MPGFGNEMWEERLHFSIIDAWRALRDPLARAPTGAAPERRAARLAGGQGLPRSATAPRFPSEAGGSCGIDPTLTIREASARACSRSSGMAVDSQTSPRLSDPRVKRCPFDPRTA